MKIYYAAQCRVCNPDDPVLYEDPDERNAETQKHADLTGHTIDLGITAR